MRKLVPPMVTIFLLAFPAQAQRSLPPAPPGGGPIERVVDSGNKSSGSGKAYSEWYTLCSDPLPIGYVIVSEEFRLEGHRHCGSWANCRISLKQSNKVCYDFQMQGHDRSPDKIYYSNGVLSYRAERQ